MKRTVSFGRAIALAGFLACHGAPQAMAQVPQATLSVDQMRNLGADLLQQGDAASAYRVADLLLQRDPKDATALIIAAQAAMMGGSAAVGADLAARAYWASTTPGASFAAARLAANAHASLGQDTRAQFWLRLARQDAPGPEQAQAIAQDYQFLRDRNPWSTQLRFGVRPSSNINNGSAARTTQLFGLPFDFELSGDARALSGIEVSAGATVQYRLRVTQTSGTFLDVEADAQKYILSQKARDQAPDASGSDYASSSLSFGLTHRQIFAPDTLPMTFTLRYGQSWYGGARNDRSLTATVSQDWRIGDKDQIGVSLLWQERRPFTDSTPVTTSGVTGSWSHAWTNDVSRFSLGYRVSQSDIIDSDFSAWRVVGSHDFGKPFNGMALGFDLDIEKRSYDATRYQPGPREDMSATARLRVRLTDVEYYGFQPVVTIEATRNASDVDLFDRDYLNLGFDLQSSF